MPFEEDELLAISALQHLLFCERRAALLYLEGLWDDNVFTVEGTLLHRRANEPGTEVRGDLRIVRGLPLCSLRLGLSGRADVVEFRRVPEGTGGIPIAGAPGRWQPVPVEYKRGVLRKEEGYEVQLCAQAFCLEEMLGTQVLHGAIYYGKSRRRIDIALTEPLRRKTESAVMRLHELLNGKATPLAVQGPKCQKCSLVDLCLPEITDGKADVKSYLEKAVVEAGGKGEP